MRKLFQRYNSMTIFKKKKKKKKRYIYFDTMRSILDYMEQMKAIQISVCDYIENVTNEEDDFLQLKNIIIDSKIQQNQNKFKSFL